VRILGHLSLPPLFKYLGARCVALASRYADSAIYDTAAVTMVAWRAKDLPTRIPISNGRLRGKDPERREARNLPVQQPTKIDMVINLKAAKPLEAIVPRQLPNSAGECTPSPSCMAFCLPAELGKCDDKGRRARQAKTVVSVFTELDRRRRGIPLRPNQEHKRGPCRHGEILRPTKFMSVARDTKKAEFRHFNC
jgi:hypothetical protein